jgi:hypothetical protein
MLFYLAFVFLVREGKARDTHFTILGGGFLAIGVMDVFHLIWLILELPKLAIFILLDIHEWALIFVLALLIWAYRLRWRQPVKKQNKNS